MKTILIFIPDLFFSTKAEDAARRLGYQVQSIGADVDFDAVISSVKPALVLVTFERTGEAWQDLADVAHRAGVKVLAFGSHKNVDAFKRAKELGCDEVVANSRLSADLPNLLRKWAS